MNMENNDCRIGGNKSTKVFVRQIPADVNWDTFNTIVADFGEVISCDRAGSEETPTAIITYKTADQAEGAADKLNKREFQSATLKASVYHDRNRNVRRSNMGGGGGGGNRDYYHHQQSHHQNGPMVGARGFRGGGGEHQYMQPENHHHVQEMPLRMVVNSRYIGAIIGQGGTNIRQVTKESKARCVVDVNRGLRDSSGNVEKVINISGPIENCSKACAKILEIVHREATKDQSNEGEQDEESNAGAEAELKLRAHNNLVGRLIGKSGSTIKKIMEETGCTIYVSNINELSAYDMERTITVRGPLENISQAEQKISLKLRQCWESDVINASGPVYGGMHPLMAAPMGGMPPPHPFIAGPSPRSAAAAVRTGPPMVAGGTPVQQGLPIAAGAFLPPRPSDHHGGGGGGGGGGFEETVHVWVPNPIVGALIGTKGMHVRSIIRQTGAIIRIDSPPKNEQHPSTNSNEAAAGATANPASSPPSNSAAAAAAGRRDSDSERRVVIIGTDQQQYKAQFWVHQRICEQGYHFFDEVRLCTEVQVPSQLIGRIIGKGGQNVRELQRVTGAQVKIPDNESDEEDENVFVQIIGSFNSSQAVQARLRQLVQQLHRDQGGRPVPIKDRSSATTNHHRASAAAQSVDGHE